MSTREMLKQDIDIMPEAVINVFQAIWTLTQKNDFADEIPNKETIAAFNEPTYKTFDTIDDFSKYIDEMDVDDEED
jgi:hypothetical protein